MPFIKIIHPDLNLQMRFWKKYWKPDNVSPLLSVAFLIYWDSGSDCLTDRDFLVVWHSWSNNCYVQTDCADFVKGKSNIKKKTGQRGLRGSLGLNREPLLGLWSQSEVMLGLIRVFNWAFILVWESRWFTVSAMDPQIWYAGSVSVPVLTSWGGSQVSTMSCPQFLSHYHYNVQCFRCQFIQSHHYLP